MLPPFRCVPFVMGAACLCPLAAAQAADPTPALMLEPVLVRGDDAEAGSWRDPALVERVDRAGWQQAPQQHALSEALLRVPGLTIRHRHNEAQDLQISIRGFGARATFGVRGLRLYVDGIPASTPDGQGQTSGFILDHASHVDVVRGPAAVMYGSSAGGAILMTTEDGEMPSRVRLGLLAGSHGLWRLSAQALGAWGDGRPLRASRTAGASGHEADSPGWRHALYWARSATDGIRPHAASDQQQLNLKLTRRMQDQQWRIQFQHLKVDAQDPLGLTREAFNQDPFQTSPVALRFNTRKTLKQHQLGLGWQYHLDARRRLDLMMYRGRREVLAFQAIPVAPQRAPSHSGGVIDLDRHYAGLNLRWHQVHPEVAGGRLSWSAGLAIDRQQDDRRGHENFVGESLGVQGRLRRDERNTAQTVDPYVQASWDSPHGTLSAGLRRSHVRYRSEDHYIQPGNGDGSGVKTMQGWLPMLGAGLSLHPELQAYVSWGQGFEPPTLNEVTYRPGALAGLNTSLQPSRHATLEGGLRGRHGYASWQLALFETRSRDELVVLSNTGGRATFQNAGRTRRQGVEWSGELRWGQLTASTALTWLDARHRDTFLTCAGTPCPAPSVPVAAGSRLPGVASTQAWMALTWRPMPAWAWTLDLLHVGRIPVNDRHSDHTAAHTLLGSSLRWARQWSAWQLDAFLRLDNLTNRRHVGSVIVNEGNGRYVEPGPPRGASLGFNLSRSF